MDSKIVTDISILIFFMVLIALRKYLFTEGFLKFLKKYWVVFYFFVFLLLINLIPGEASPYQGYILIISAFFIGYFFIYAYFVVNISSLKNREGLRKRWEIAWISIAPLPPIYRAYDYFTTEPYHILDIVIFIFFLGTVIFISRFLLKEAFFSKEKSE